MTSVAPYHILFRFHPQQSSRPHQRLFIHGHRPVPTFTYDALLSITPPPPSRTPLPQRPHASSGHLQSHGFSWKSGYRKWRRCVMCSPTLFRGSDMGGRGGLLRLRASYSRTSATSLVHTRLVYEARSRTSLTVRLGTSTWTCLG